MSVQMKYVSFEVVSGFERIVIFSGSISHRDIAIAMKSQNPEIRFLGAGFVGKEGEHLRCYGDSFTMGFSCRKVEDNELLHQNLNDD